MIWMMLLWKQLSKAMGVPYRCTCGSEDEKKYLKELFEKHPDFAEKFTSEIVIPVFTNDELSNLDVLMLTRKITRSTKKQSRRSMIESVSGRKRVDRLP